MTLETLKSTFKALRDVDIVFHTAARVDVVASTREPFVDLEENILGTLSVCEAARKNDVSTNSIRQALPCTEMGMFFLLTNDPIRPISRYAASSIPAG